MNSTSCPLTALKKAGKPVEITMWHSMPRANGETLQKLTDAFNSSQSDVKVNLVNQIDYVQTFNKYKAGLSSGDLPDIVQLQETDQQQMIDTQTVLPASVCAKADKYSFSDFLPRVISYFTVQGTQYAMPFNTSGPVLYYNKKAFTRGRPRSEQAAEDTRRRAGRGREAQGERCLGAARAQDRARVSSSTGGRSANKTYVNNSNGRKARATKTVYDDATGRQIFTWLSGMVKDGLATTNPDTRHRRVRQPARDPERFARDGVRHQRRARHDQLGARRRQRPQRRARRRALPGAHVKRQGRRERERR